MSLSYKRVWVRNNRRLVAALRAEGYAGGQLGTDRYESAIRSLHRHAQAYEHMDDARQAMFNGDYEEAISLIDQALRAQNKEARFHGLRGDIRSRQDRFEDAVTNYDRALSRDPDYYGFFLGRGMAYARLNDLTVARADLNRSLELLPTTIAYLELGKISETLGDEAAEHP